MVEAAVTSATLHPLQTEHALVVALARGQKSEQLGKIRVSTLPGSISHVGIYQVAPRGDLFGIRLQPCPVGERVDAERAVPID
jgi:hypothetical protein